MKDAAIHLSNLAQWNFYLLKKKNEWERRLGSLTHVCKRDERGCLSWSGLEKQEVFLLLAPKEGGRW